MESSRTPDGLPAAKRKVFVVNIAILMVAGLALFIDGLSRIIIEQDKMRAANPFAEVVFGLVFMGLGYLINKWRNSLHQ